MSKLEIIIKYRHFFGNVYICLPGIIANGCEIYAYF